MSDNFVYNESQEELEIPRRHLGLNARQRYEKEYSEDRSSMGGLLTGSSLSTPCILIDEAMQNGFRSYMMRKMTFARWLNGDRFVLWLEGLELNQQAYEDRYGLEDL